MLDAKGIAYDRIDLFPLSRVWLRLTGFGSRTAPAVRLDRVRFHGSRTISTALC